MKNKRVIHVLPLLPQNSSPHRVPGKCYSSLGFGLWGEAYLPSMATKCNLEWAARFAEAYAGNAQVGRENCCFSLPGGHMVLISCEGHRCSLQAYGAAGRVIPWFGAVPFLDYGRRRRALKLRSLWLNRKQICSTERVEEGLCSSWHCDVFYLHTCRRLEEGRVWLSWWLTIRHVRKARGPYEDLVLNREYVIFFSAFIIKEHSLQKWGNTSTWTDDFFPLYHIYLLSPIEE